MKKIAVTGHTRGIGKALAGPGHLLATAFIVSRTIA